MLRMLVLAGVALYPLVPLLSLTLHGRFGVQLTAKKPTLTLQGVPSYGDFERKFLPPTKYVVFTAAGDNHNIDAWFTCGKVNFHTYVVYYGDNPDRAVGLQKKATYFEMNKGWKFNLLQQILRDEPKLFEPYLYIFVPDDDLTLTAAKISILFAVHESEGLTLSGPSQERKRSGWYSQVHVEDSLLRRGAFVEVHSMLFTTSVLSKFYSIYDGTIIGWGFDLMFYSAMKVPARNYAVVDAVVMYHKKRAIAKREISAFFSDSMRVGAWGDYKKRHQDQWRDADVKQLEKNWTQVGFGEKKLLSSAPALVTDMLRRYGPVCVEQSN